MFGGKGRPTAPGASPYDFSLLSLGHGRDQGVSPRKRTVAEISRSRHRNDHNQGRKVSWPSLLGWVGWGAPGQLVGETKEGRSRRCERQRRGQRKKRLEQSRERERENECVLFDPILHKDAWRIPPLTCIAGGGNACWIHPRNRAFLPPRIGEESRALGAILSGRVGRGRKWDGQGERTGNRGGAESARR